MTFEMLFSDKKLNKKPYLLFFVALFCVLISLILSINIFPNSASIVMVTFTIIPLIPIFIQLIKDQEDNFEHKTNILNIKKSIIIPYIYLFIGLIVGFSAAFIILPDSISEVIFKEQIDSIYDLEGPFGFLIYEDKIIDTRSCMSLGVDKTKYQDYNFDKCHFADYNKNGISDTILSKEGVPKFVVADETEIYKYKNFIAKHIFLNNFGVLIFIFFTSFIFGAGSLFILTWNASIIGIFIGDALKRATNMMIKYPVFDYAINLPKIILPLLTHGVFELAGFFNAAISGGVLSIALIRHKVTDKEFKLVLKDSIELLLLSVLLITIGALIEGYY